MSAVLPKPTGASARVVSAIPLVLVGIVFLLMVPLPAVLLDLLLASSLALSVALLLAAIHMERPLDLSAFPTILLFATLLRLALNVASTRLILLRGPEGTTAAGDVIRAFGEFIVGGNFVVGSAIFVLLVIINFVVITKGAGRVAEVSARFTLDAMPGKQMAIDADLAAGTMTHEQAKARRKEIEREADFFGAMDGASKFVRGDALAGLLMTAVNLIVGIIVGVVQNGMSAGDAASTYTILTVGDGLASQVPALLVSTAAGVVVTRAASSEPLGSTLVTQLGASREALFTTAGVLGGVAMLPGMPTVPFLGLAAAIGMAGRAALRPGEGGDEAPAATDGQAPDEATADREQIKEMLPLDRLELEVGFDLVTLVDAGRGGDLVERIGAIRKNLAQELGLILPSIHIRDNLQLPSTTYRLLLAGNEVGRGELRVNKLLAMDPTGSLSALDGERVTEPAFGLPAIWIAERLQTRAEALGYTVVDPATVAATHLTELLRLITPELLGRSEAQELIDLVARDEPRLVDELIPNLLPLGEVMKVLRNLLGEGVSIRDLRSILEALADHARELKDPEALTERVRQRLARTITARFRADDGTVAAIVLAPAAEQHFRALPLPAPVQQALLTSLNQAASSFATVSTPPLVLCAADVRRAVAAFFGSRVPGLSVASYAEIDAKTTVRTLAHVTG
ncbi:MAG: flagellar biosynthesis protein FlhA [Myxococcota bacterium]